MHHRNNCCQGPNMHHGMQFGWQMGHTPCGCGCHGKMLLNKKEQRKKLEEYKKMLENELEDVNEAIEELGN